MSTKEVLSDAEMDALMEHNESTKQVNPSQAMEVNPYDFAQNTSKTLNDLEKFNTINDLLNQTLSQSLTSFFSRKIIFESGEVQIMSYQEVKNSLTNPGIFNLISFDKLKGIGLIDFNMELISTVIEGLFGGDVNNLTNESIKFGKIELQIAKLLTDKIITGFSSAWEIITPLQFSVARTVTNSKLVAITEENNNVLILNYQFTIDSVTRSFRLCIPCNVLEPIRHLIESEAHSDATEQEQLDWRNKLRTNVNYVSFQLTCVVDRTEIELNRLMKLKAGDVIYINNPKQADIYADGIHLYHASCGAKNGNRAFKVEKFADS